MGNTVAGTAGSTPVLGVDPASTSPRRDLPDDATAVIRLLSRDAVVEWAIPAEFVPIARDLLERA